MIETQKDWLYQQVIGIDEVGRGPLAGPVVVCAFFLDDVARLPQKIQDSKKLSIKRRQSLNEVLVREFKYAISVVSNNEIDEINILQATHIAMRDAYAKLEQNIKKEFGNSVIVLIDGKDNPLKSIAMESKAIIQGDSKSYAVACASIIAKVYRDNLMQELSKMYPQYGWERNAGYGTKEHIKAIYKYGLTPYHRISFIKNILKTA